MDIKPKILCIGHDEPDPTMVVQMMLCMSCAVTAVKDDAMFRKIYSEQIASFSYDLFLLDPDLAEKLLKLYQREAITTREWAGFLVEHLGRNGVEASLNSSNG